MKVVDFKALLFFSSFCFVSIQCLPGHWECGKYAKPVPQNDTQSTYMGSPGNDTSVPGYPELEAAVNATSTNTTTSIETNIPFSNDTVPVEPGAPSSNDTAPVVINTPSSNDTVSIAINGSTETSSLPTFIAGGDVGTVLRQQAIPGRIFHDLNNDTTTDPIGALADIGFNAARVETQNGQCLVTSSFDNSNNVLSRELLFTLDWGCIDVQVNTAKAAAAKGMKIILTINMGTNIPTAWLQNSYAQMIDAIMTESKRQLQPFLAAGIVPYIILLENEGSDGMLFNDANGHVRGSADGKASQQQVNDEACGKIPTGNTDSYPQLAGYYKAEIAACKAAITAAGLDLSTIRFGLHSHGQYVDWKAGLVYGTQEGLETSLTTPSGVKCNFQGIIPDDLLNVKASDELDIVGFSSYPDPIAPIDPDDEASISATLDRLRTTISVLNPIVQRYGRATSGPFQGQWQKQALGVEYASHFTPAQFSGQEKQTQMMFSVIKAQDWFLGMMWYEPWYCYSDWEGGYGALCTKWSTNTETNVALDPVAKLWGQSSQASN